MPIPTRDECWDCRFTLPRSDTVDMVHDVSQSTPYVGGNHTIQGVRPGTALGVCTVVLSGASVMWTPCPSTCSVT